MMKYTVIDLWLILVPKPSVVPDSVYETPEKVALNLKFDLRFALDNSNSIQPECRFSIRPFVGIDAYIVHEFSVIRLRAISPLLCIFCVASITTYKPLNVCPYTTTL